MEGMCNYGLIIVPLVFVFFIVDIDDWHIMNYLYATIHKTREEMIEPYWKILNFTLDKQLYK